jgi:uncharacterized protein YbjT (DUF2867 family)
MDNQPILVLGGTGHYGRHIVHALQGRGAAVRVLSRDARRARALLGDVEVVEGDLRDHATVARALAGTRALVVSVSAFAPATIRQVREIECDAVLDTLAEAERAGPRRVVYLSTYEANPEVAAEVKLESGAIKADVEAALARSSLNWTVLGLPPSMELFFAMLRGGTMIVPGGGPPALPTVSPVDVGEIAAQAALRDDLAGQRIRLTAPEALSFPEAARRIGRATGRNIRFRKIPLVLPRIAAVLLTPFALVSNRVLFVRQMLGFIQLLNRFPAVDVAADFERLQETFDYTPTTLEREVSRRKEEDR